VVGHGVPVEVDLPRGGVAHEDRGATYRGCVAYPASTGVLWPGKTFAPPAKSSDTV
jgi:hypothetical protein